MEPIQYDQFRTSDNEGGQKLIPQRGMQVKVVYLLYGVLVLLLLILLLVTGLKFSQLNQDLADVKISLETIDKSVRAQVNPVGPGILHFNFEDIEPVRGPCDEGWLHFQGSCYLFSSTKADWNAAEQECLRHGFQTHLAVVNTVEELKYMSSISDDRQNYWLGLVDRAEEGHWIWIDGTDFLTPNLWDIGQPDNWDYHENGEDCGMLHSHTAGSPKLKLLNDAECNQEYRYICEETGK